jgi:hypothetical protein
MERKVRHSKSGKNVCMGLEMLFIGIKNDFYRFALDKSHFGCDYSS